MKRVTKYDAHVGKRLKLKRINLGISQKVLGKLLDITFQQIQKYEKGTNRISSGKLWETSVILNTPIEYFFAGLENPVKLKENSFECEDLGREILIISRLLKQVTDKRKRKDFIATIKNILKFIK